MPDPETAAQALLREFEARFSLDGVPPSPVERIATSLLDLLIDEHDDLRELPGAPTDQGRLSGMIDPPNMTIWLDRREARGNPRRRRFTISHEIGHWQLHVASTGEVMADGPATLVEHEDEGVASSTIPDLRRREKEANSFARELLMPELLVQQQARATGCNLPLLAERFEVSVPAIRLRLRLLGLLPVGMG